MTRALMRVVAAAVVGSVVFTACSPAPPTHSAVTGEQSQRRPIVIVRGWGLSCGLSGADAWPKWREASYARGYPEDAVGVLRFDTCRPNGEAIAELGVLIDGLLRRTGAEKVNVIAHSMGSLIGRACIRFGSCAGKVDKFLSLAAPNHGTIWAHLCQLAFWSASTCDMNPDGPFLAELNAGDETWGDVDYTTMISWCDLTIVPFTSAHLDGRATSSPTAV